MENRLHNLMIIIGPKGIGKKHYLKEYCKENNLEYISFGNKIDDVRDLIEYSKNIRKESLLVIEDGDNLSIQAQNCLLKTMENPQNCIHIAICTSNSKHLLGTTFSRSTFTYYIPYPSKSDLQLYAKNNFKLLEKGFETSYFDFILNISTTYGDLNFWFKKDIENFKAYDNLTNKFIKTYTNNGEVDLGFANSFAFKEDEDGYDPYMFVKLVVYKLYNYLLVEPNKRQLITNLIRICSSTISYLNTENNKRTFDLFIIKVKRECEKYATIKT